MRHSSRSAVIVLAGMASLLTAGCATSIGHVLANPRHYADHDVSVSGDVTRSVGILGHGAFELDDGTGRLWVVSDRGIPRRGAHVKASGRVRDVVDVGSLVKLPLDIGSGVVLVEGRDR